MRDVTERKTQEQALEDARAEAERANAAKSRFLATMSHELRTPLNAIIGFSEMLTNEDALRLDAERRHEYAKLINDSGHHLLSVVNGILDMSKIETGNFEITPEPFAPAQRDRRLLRSPGAARRARPASSSSMRVAGRAAGDHRRQARPQPDPAQSPLQRDQVHRSRRHGHGQRRRRVDDGAIIAVAVEDTGVGIGADDLPRVGDPFFQARSSYDRRHDGTGLGLSIVKGLAGAAWRRPRHPQPARRGHARHRPAADRLRSARVPTQRPRSTPATVESNFRWPARRDRNLPMTR